MEPIKVTVSTDFLQSIIDTFNQCLSYDLDNTNEEICGIIEDIQLLLPYTEHNKITGCPYCDRNNFVEEIDIVRHAMVKHDKPGSTTKAKLHSMKKVEWETYTDFLKHQYSIEGKDGFILLYGEHLLDKLSGL